MVFLEFIFAPLMIALAIYLLAEFVYPWFDSTKEPGWIFFNKKKKPPLSSFEEDLKEASQSVETARTKVDDVRKKAKEAISEAEKDLQKKKDIAKGKLDPFKKK